MARYSKELSSEFENTFTLEKTHTKKKDPLGPYSIPGQRWPGNCSTCRGICPIAGSIWPHYLSSVLKTDQILGHFNLTEWSTTTMDPFPGHIDPGVFRALFWYNYNYYNYIFDIIKQCHKNENVRHLLLRQLLRW